MIFECDRVPKNMSDLLNPAPQPTSMAYLVSQYPTLSMIFVLREVLQLRKRGFRIDVASINDPDREPEALTADERSESSRAFYVLAQGVSGALKAHLLALLSSPTAYMRGLALVFRLGGLDAKRLFKNGVYFTESLIVGQWMQRVGQTHLHVHLGSQAATVGLFVKSVYGFGYSLTVHGPDEFYDALGQYLAEKIKAADFIVCISHFARSQLMKLSPHSEWSKLHVSRLGVDPAVFVPRWTLPAEGQMFEVLCVGRLTPAKGQHLLIDAIGMLHRRGLRVVLRLVGGGVDDASLKEQVQQQQLQDTVIFEGPINQDRIREFYARAHCFCIPSFAEGIPVVLMEAMAMGIPCVTTHITGIPELIVHGESGILVAPSDVQGLADALARLMSDPALCNGISVQGRKRVTAHYHLHENAEGLARLFSEQVPAFGQR